MSLRYASHRFGDHLVEQRVETPTVLSLRTARVTDPDGLLVVDAKSLYDSLHSQQANQDDHRSALESSMVKEDLEKLGGAVCWIPHDENPSDALAKVEGAHCTPLMELLSNHLWHLTYEEVELEARKQVRDDKGYNPRPRHSALTTIHETDADMPTLAYPSTAMAYVEASAEPQHRSRCAAASRSTSFYEDIHSTPALPSGCGVAGTSIFGTLEEAIEMVRSPAADL